MNKFSDSSLDEIKKIESDPIIQFLKQDTLYVNLMSSSPIYSNVYISTPNGTSVAALKLISGDMSQGDKDDYKDSNLEIYDNRITFAGEATYAYNCHAYAWYVSEGYSYVWLNTPGDDAFWNDGSYVLTTDMSRAKKVSYASDDHSAIIASQNGYFKSKWGAGPLFIHKPTDCPYNASTLRYYRYPDPNYDDVPSKPLPKAFNMISSGAFTAEVSNDARYEVDLYEWKVDYPNDWSIVPLNTIKSKVNVYQSSSPRSCYLYARAHNSFGWGEWQSIGWVYVSNSYSLSVLQNSGGAMLQVQIKPNAEMQNGDKAVKLENQTYQVALYSNTGVCVYQTTVNNNGTNVVNLNIDVSQVSNGVYFLNVRNTKANEGPQTMNIMIKH